MRHGVECILFRDVQIYRLIISIQILYAQHFHAVRIGMDGIITSVVADRAPDAVPVPNRYISSNDNAICLFICDREVGVSLLRLHGSLILKTIRCASSVERLGAFGRAFNKIEYDLKGISNRSSSPVSFSLRLIICDHVVVRLLSFWL